MGKSQEKEKLKPGVSTACFYPEETKTALQTLLLAGIKNVEIFFNTDSELSDSYVDTLKEMTEHHGAQICAVHPFYCAYDWFYLYSNYHGRHLEGIEKYKHFFDKTARLGVEYISFHGAHPMNNMEFTQWCDIYADMFELAKGFGVTLCHENVSRNVVRTPQDFANIIQHTSGNVAFTVDVKQARRSECSALELIDTAGECLKHVHLSTATQENDCVTPDVNDKDTLAVLQKLKQKNYQNSIVVELYRNGFEQVGDIANSIEQLQQFCRN